MSTAPDFKAIARGVEAEACAGLPEWDSDDAKRLVSAIAEQLRLVWNARGAADALAVETRVRELVAGEIVGAGLARHVADAIAKVDR
jgi:hypothetical protein